MQSTETLTTFIPIDRCYAIAHGIDLPDQTCGAALVADISGFTLLTETLSHLLGPKRGAEEVTRQLNMVYDALIPEIHNYRGSVITFSGDAIVCWFDRDDGRHATACALTMQQIIARFAHLTTESGVVVSLAIKAAIATGPVRRLLVGDPHIQIMDVIAGATLDGLSVAERHAHKGEVVLTAPTALHLADMIDIAFWRVDEETDNRFAIVTSMRSCVEPASAPLNNLHALTPALDVRPWILPPVHERLRTGQEQFLGEIRPAVALFLRFGGIDYDHDPHAGPQLNAYIRWVQNILARYEGFLLQVIMGDKGSYLYATFGALLAHDDDADRAVAAALDLIALPAELSYITGIQIGISRGLMHAGAYGSTARRTYGVLGDEVNLAARLMSQAAPGRILVSGRVAHSVRQRYELKPMGLIQIRGKKDPVPVAQVDAKKLPANSHTNLLFTTHLVGRERELNQFDHVLNLALAGDGQILRLEGIAGIGKSHLIATFGERAMQRNVRVSIGACQSISQNIAYTPWRQVLWDLFGLSDVTNGLLSVTAHQIAHIEAQLAQINPDWVVRLPLLAELLGLPIPDNPTTAAFTPQLRQEALFTLVIDLIQAWARAQPLLLLLEDVHWMDEASLGLALALCRVIAQIPMLLTIAHRPVFHEERVILPEIFFLPCHHVMELNELTRGGVQDLVANRLQAPVSPLLLSLIQIQAQGNPFFIEELIDALRETGKLTYQDGYWTLAEGIVQALRDAQALERDETGAWRLAPNASLPSAQLGIPDSIHGVVLSRLDRMPESHKLTLKVASVIGRIFEFDVLQQVHPAHPDPTALLEQIRMSEERDFTRIDAPWPRLTYVFRHSVTQEVVYNTLLETQQRDLHHAVGEALERLQPDAVEQMAYHFSRSGVRDKTLRYLEQAARKAQRDYANETALSCYTQALALQENWQWRQGQIEVLHTLGRREEQQVALQALEAAPDAPIFVVAYLRGQYYEAIGDYTLAEQAIERALADCQERNDLTGEAQCLYQLGVINRRQGDYEQARAWYEEAKTLFQYESSPSDKANQTLVEALNGLGSTYLQQGIFEQAQAYFEQALRLSRTTGHRKGEADALNSLGNLFSYQRRLTEALVYYQEALDLQRAIGDRDGEGTSLGNMAQVIHDLGDYIQAEKYLSVALAIQQAIGNRWNEINNWNDLGLLYQELGNLERARECLKQGLWLSQVIGDEAGQAYILANLGLVAYDQEDLATAEQLLKEGLKLAQGQDDLYLIAGFRNYLSSVSLKQKQFVQAIEYASAALIVYQELDLRLYSTYDLTNLAVSYLALGASEEALDYARQALHILDECGGNGPETPQRDYFLCAQVLAAIGDSTGTRTALHSAYKLVLERAEKIVDPELRQSFLERVPINRQIMQAMAPID